MRRLTSILTSLAVAAGAVSISSSVAMAAGGTKTITRSATYSPSAVANAAPQRMLRLEKSNEFLAIGRNKNVAGSNFFVWKMKEDLTFNTTFGAIDLGADFSAPTSSNSVCVASSHAGCLSIRSFSINEAADLFAVIIGRQLKGSGSGASSDSTILSVYLGKISTGAVVARAKYLEMGSYSTLNASDWSSYNASQLGRDICTAGNGATINNSPLTWAWTNLWQTAIRADGALIITSDCSYSNVPMNLSQSIAVREYDGAVMTALKPSNGSFVIDTSFATNGYFKMVNSATECGNVMPASTSDTSATTSSTKTFLLAQVATYARQTTIPSGFNNQFYTSYEGCSFSGMPTETPRITSLQANGKVKKTVALPTGKSFYTNRWIIDPQGRWNAIVSIMNMNSPSSSPTLVRVLPDGSLDTSIGADGMKELTGLPTSVTVNGTSVSMRYSVSGIAQTSSDSLFVGFASSGMSTCGGNTPSGTYTSTAYPYYFSIEKGLVTTYGTNGLGDPVSSVVNNADVCSGESLGGASYINSEGRPASVRVNAAVGQQAAELLFVVWDAATGVVGGGDGTVSAGSAGRVDKKVYSTKLPTTVQTDSALQVITAKQAKDLDIRTSTPKICIALTTSVLLVNPGRCVVRIIDEDTKKVLRTMTTTVKATDVDAGTTLTTDEPIYFKQANVKLSKTALAQVKELAAAAATASRIVVIGHSAALGDVSQYSYAISRNRAEAVKAALIKAGVKKPIEVVALAYNQPEKTAKTEAAQAKNRRAEVFIFP